VGALGLAAGRCLDLAAELRAHDLLRRARYGVRAQAERELAEKIDELAKLDGVLADAQARRTGASAGLGRGAAAAEEGELAERVREALRRIEAPLDELERAIPRTTEGAAGAALRAVRDGMGELERALGAPAALEARDLGPLVLRAVERLRAELAGGPEIAARVDAVLPVVRCRGAEIGEIVERLVRSALLASEGVRRIDVSLRETPGGVELTVAHDGAGLEDDVVERVFDPFAGGAGSGAAPAGAPPSAESGAGLSAVWLTVEEHGGQLRVETDPERGTRITVVFPRAC
jgi:signal transduction histidine kinase